MSILAVNAIQVVTPVEVLSVEAPATTASVRLVVAIDIDLIRPVQGVLLEVCSRLSTRPQQSFLIESLRSSLTYWN